MQQRHTWLIALLGFDTYCEHILPRWLMSWHWTSVPCLCFLHSKNGWNAASHLPRERASCKVTLYWIVFPFFFLCHFCLHGLLCGAKPPFCWARWKNQNVGEKNNQIKWINGCLAWPDIVRQVCAKPSIKCYISDLIESHSCFTYTWTTT